MVTDFVFHKEILFKIEVYTWFNKQTSQRKNQFIERNFGLSALFRVVSLWRGLQDHAI